MKIYKRCFVDEYYTEINGQEFIVDENGFLLNGFDLPEEEAQLWVKYLMVIYGINEFTHEHHKVIIAVREYYKKNGISPMARILCKITMIPMMRLYELFPKMNDIIRMARLPYNSIMISQ